MLRPGFETVKGCLRKIRNLNPKAFIIEEATCQGPMKWVWVAVDGCVDLLHAVVCDLCSDCCM